MPQRSLVGSKILSVTLTHPFELAPGIGVQKLENGKAYGRHLDPAKAEVFLEWVWYDSPGTVLQVKYLDRTVLIPMWAISSFLIGD